jgi:hypothetical protein
MLLKDTKRGFMNETEFTNKVRKFISDKAGGSIKLGASRFLAKGTPDLVCCLKYTFFLEDKVYPNRASPIQLACIKKLREEGFFAWVLTYRDSEYMLDEKSYNSLEDVFKYIGEYIGQELGKSSDRAEVL